MTVTVESRMSWTSRKLEADMRPLAAYEGVAVHWPVGRNLAGLPHSACQAELKRLEEMQVSGNTASGDVYANIAYQLVACLHGKLMEGRTRNRVNAANGTETPQANTRWGSVMALIGTGDPINDLLLHAILQAPEYLGAKPNLFPHSQIKATACPGPDLTAWLKAGAPAPEEDDVAAADVWKVEVDHPITGTPTDYGRVATSTLRRAIQAEATAAACLKLLQDGSGGVVTQAMVDKAVADALAAISKDIADGPDGA